MDALQQFDAGIFSAINGWHAAYFDSFMWLVTKIATWIPMILMLLYLLYFKKGWRKTVAVVLAIALVILIADQVSASIIKPLVERARPSHNESLQSTIHIVNGYRGGPFGFVSSHAANFMAIATLLTFITRQRLVLFSLVTWTLLQCYSRMYLGVHYPGDILGGLIVGALAGWLVWCLMRWIQRRWRLPEGHYTRFDAALMASAAAISVIGLLTAALIIQ